MNYFRLVSLWLVLTVLMTGCTLEHPLEDRTMTLLLGIDLDEENNLTFYEVSPIFNESAKDKVEVIEVKANSIRQSSREFDARTTGEITGSKIQVLILGQRILEQDGWFSILDAMYRNSAFSSNTRVVMTKDPVSKIVNFKAPQKPLVFEYVKDLIDQYNRRNYTVLTTLRELHRQIFEKGMTPSISEIEDGDDLHIIGTALLDDKEKYIYSLTPEQTTILLILQKEEQKQILFTGTSLTNKDENSVLHKNEMAFTAQDAKTKIKVSHNDDHFTFDIKIKLDVVLTEILFPFDLEKDRKKLEKAMQTQLEKKFIDFIQKFQEHKIDPVGLGLYARAYHYKEYKKVEDHWGEILANSTINVSIDLSLVGRGSVK